MRPSDIKASINQYNHSTTLNAHLKEKLNVNTLERLDLSVGLSGSRQEDIAIVGFMINVKSVSRYFL